MRVNLTHLCISIAYIHKIIALIYICHVTVQADSSHQPQTTDSSHLACQYCMWCKQLANTLLTVVLNSYLSVKTKAQTIMIAEKKRALKKIQKLKKSLGLSPQLSWLTTVCLRGFDRNIPQLLPVFSLDQCLQCTIKNELKQISISNQHSSSQTMCV